MNTKQEDKLSMYYVLKNTADKYQTTWSTNSIFAASYNLWVAKLPLIEQNRDVQILEISGITTDKSIKRVNMTDKALFIVNRLQSYANVTANAELFESVKYSVSDMKKARDTDVVGICNTIFAKANANAAALVTYGVTAAMITELQTAITAYLSTIAKPKSAASQTKTATENLKRLFKEADDILSKRLDLDIEVFKTSKPDFYSQYKSARIIIATNGAKVSLLGNVLSSTTKEPVKGVSFTLSMENNGVAKSASTDTVKPIIKKSAAKGNFRIQNMSEGTYKVTVKKIGFKDQVLNINIVNGETTNLKVELEMD